MALDPKYVLGPPLEYYFVDKTTGLPLAGGIVTFYSDVNRTTPKPVYQLTGDPFLGYNYTILPNPLILSSVGTFNYLGNDIVPYFYPYDANGNVELYYITVEAADFTPQFTREAWPNIFAQTSTSEALDLENFIPNGQFVLHNNIPANDIIGSDPNEITTPITEIAPGGWTYEIPVSSSTLDFVSFFRFGSYVANPTASPRFAVQIQCEGPNPTDSFKDLRIKFDDVNKFASDTNEYTLSFTAKTSVGTLPVNLFLIQNYGTGGSPSPTVTTFLTTFTFTNLYPSPPTNFTFNFPPLPTNLPGDNDDDFLQLAWSFPTDQTFTVDMTDFVLTPGSVAIDQFPPTTTSQFLSDSLVPPVPDYNGLNLGLPIILTKTGYGYDNSQIGKVFSTTAVAAAFGERLCNGDTLETAGYSADGIPFSRLYQVLLASGTSRSIPVGIAAFGTGPNYVNCYPYTATPYANFTINTNIAGGQSVTADGAVPTGFVFNTLITGQSNIGFNADISATATVNCRTALIGVPFGVNGSSTPSIVVPSTESQPYPFSGRRGTSSTNQVAIIEVNSVPPASSYINITNTTTQYYVWFNVNGVGVDPAPGGTGIELKIYGTMTTNDIASAIASALSAFQISSVTVNQTGGTLTPNSYFSFFANSQRYVVWYSLNGLGTQPVVPNAIYIPVSYVASDSASTIGQNTLIAINSKYYALPDLRGLFIRGYDPTQIYDYSGQYRFSQNQLTQGNYIGSIEIDAIVSHLHTISNDQSAGATAEIQIRNSGPPGMATDTVDDTGGSDTRPINMALNYVIKI